MKKRPEDSFRRLLFWGLLLTGLILPQRGNALNRVGDVKRLEDGSGGVRIVMRLKERPRYSLKSEVGKGLLLILYDTEKSPVLEKKITEEKGLLLQVEEDRRKSLLRLSFPLKRAPRDLTTAWLPEEKILSFELKEAAEKTSSGRQGRKRAVVLKNIRFGVQADLTRIVMDVNQNPPWEMIRREDRLITLNLGAADRISKRKKYGPMKRLKTVVIKKAGRGVDVGIRLEMSHDHLRLFWLKDLGRFVMDLYDRPKQDPGASVSLISGFDVDTPDKTEPLEKKDRSEKGVESAGGKEKGNRTEEVGVKVVKQKISTPPLRKAVEETSGEKASTALEKSEEAPKETAGMDEAEERGPASDHTADSGPQPYVRQKISAKGPSESAAKKSPPKPQGPPLQFNPGIQIGLDNALPDDAKIKSWAVNLDAGEAFLFGRIQEAWELKDYDKGATLIDQYLTTYPESPLCEHMAFLRGDFRLYLLKSGRKEVVTALLQSYRDAITRYPESKEVPWTYIKIAQADFLVGNYYPAISTLNVVTFRFPKGDHLAEAYLLKGKTYLKMDQQEKGVENFKLILEQFPQSPLVNEARFWIATYFHNKGIYEEAEKRLGEIEKSDPKFYSVHPEYLFLYARNYFYRKKYEPSREYFLKALNLGRQPETDDLILSRIGDTYHHQERKTDAESYYNAAIESFPESEGASIAQLRLAKYSSGVSEYQEVHERNVNKPLGDLALLEMGNALYERGQYTDAIAKARNLIKKPTNIDINNEAKRLYFRASAKEIMRFYEAGELEALITFYETAQPPLTKDIDREVLAIVARSYSKKSRYTEAITLYSAIRPVDLKMGARGKVLLDFARAYIAGGDDEGAERLLLKNLKGKLEGKNRQRMAVLLAEIYQRKGDLDKALRRYRSVSTTDSTLPKGEIARVYLAMGEISNLQNHYEEARHLLNQSITLAEEAKDGGDCMQLALIAFGNSYFLQKMYDHAVDFYNRGIDQGYGPDSRGYWNIRYRQGLSYMELGRNQQAEEVLREVADGGDALLQQQVQIKLGSLGLENQLKRLPIWEEGKGAI